MTLKEALSIDHKPWTDYIRKHVSVKDAVLFDEFIETLKDAASELIDLKHLRSKP